MSTRLGQYQLTLVPAASDGVRQTLVHVRASAADALKFAGAPSVFVHVFLEVRTLLPALVHLVSAFKVVSACSGALPALVGQVLVLTHAVLDELRKRRTTWDDDASHRSVDELVSFVRLLLVPLVHHAGDGTSYVHGLTGGCLAVGKDEERYWRGYEQLLEAHGCPPFISLPSALAAAARWTGLMCVASPNTAVSTAASSVKASPGKRQSHIRGL